MLRLELEILGFICVVVAAAVGYSNTWNTILYKCVRLVLQVHVYSLGVVVPSDTSNSSWGEGSQEGKRSQVQKTFNFFGVDVPEFYMLRMHDACDAC